MAHVFAPAAVIRGECEVRNPVVQPSKNIAEVIRLMDEQLLVRDWNDLELLEEEARDEQQAPAVEETRKRREIAVKMAVSAEEETRKRKEMLANLSREVPDGATR